MNVAEFLGELQRDPNYRDQIVHLHELPARAAAYAAPAEPLHDGLQRALRLQSIRRLYTHQAAAIDAVRAGKNIVVVTGTASGKTMCYNLPVIEKLLADPEARALYVFPTKALAQDQLRVLQTMAELDPELGAGLRPATYDGDTPSGQRRKTRGEARVILTNPDMLHQGILPYHTKWIRFLQNLRYVVLDEVHTYRGIFGSHVAGVLRRLRRVCQHYPGAGEPQFIGCSATIANPREHAEKLVGKPFQLIDDDGSPRGRRCFVLWNPPPLRGDGLQRRSANMEAHDLMNKLVVGGQQTITFAKARIAAELIFRYLRERFGAEHKNLVNRIRPYRGGYLPKERREIEQELFSGRLLGVCATNALELGIDIGTLDAAIIVGFPGTICSTWQQAGRAGRRNAESVAFLVAYNDPIDQYLVRHPDYFFGRPHEQAVVDPQNRSILSAQLKCAAREIMLDARNQAVFGDQALELCQELYEQDPQGGWWRDPRSGDWHYNDNSSALPHRRVSLRNISEQTYVITEQKGDRAEVIGNVDGISAPELVYPQAVYLHEGDSYIVRQLDQQARVAHVERAEVDYYTQAVLSNSCRITETLERDRFRGGARFFGNVEVTWQTVGFKKIKYYTLEVVGQAALDLEPQTIPTQALWVQAPAELLENLRLGGYNPFEGLVGLRNMMLVALPFLAMADRHDISGVVNTSQPGAPTMFVYDRYPGGVGYARAGYQRLDELLAMCQAIVRECDCVAGCPSCVGLANLRPPLHADPDLGTGYAIPNKEAAAMLLDQWLA